MAATTITVTSKTEVTLSSPSPFPNWADKPLPLLATPLGQTPLSKAHGALQMAQGMTQLHNMVLRCINSTYQQAPHVSATQDIKDFIQFVGFWIDFLEHHHETEEIAFFPALEKLTGSSMEGNVAQHRAFEAGLAALLAWTKETTPETYSAPALIALLDNLGPILQTHLAEEIDTLLALREHADSAGIKRIWDEAGDYARAHGELNKQVPFVAGSQDMTFEGGASTDIVFPWIVKVLNNWVLSKKYAGAWRFLPCDFSGKPRPLLFAPKE